MLYFLPWPVMGQQKPYLLPAGFIIPVRMNRPQYNNIEGFRPYFSFFSFFPTFPIIYLLTFHAPAYLSKFPTTPQKTTTLISQMDP